MTQPATARQLTDGERIAILDARLAKVLDNKYHNNQLVQREPFSAVVRLGTQPITSSDWFWGIVLTIFAFGLGLVYLAVVFYLKKSESRIRHSRFDVTPTGEIVITKLPT